MATNSKMNSGKIRNKSSILSKKIFYDDFDEKIPELLSQNVKCHSKSVLKFGFIQISKIELLDTCLISILSIKKNWPSFPVTTLNFAMQFAIQNFDTTFNISNWRHFSREFRHKNSRNNSMWPHVASKQIDAKM